MLLSVIIPTFNRATELSICIQSILNCHLKDLQIIIIDDGSSDKTKYICNDFKQLDNRIEYYFQENKGVSAARNLGITKARGEWISFCDSDDVVRPEHFDIISQYQDKKNTLLMCGSSILNVQGNSFTLPEIKKDNLIKEPNAVKFLFSDNFNPYRHGFFFIWNKFFNKSIIDKNNLRFDENLSLDEDMHFTLRYLQHVQGLVYNPSPTYLTVERPNVSHLGRKKRSPEEYVTVHKSNLKEYLKLAKITNLKEIEYFGKYYAVSRTIRLAIIDSPINLNLRILKSSIIPFIKGIKINNYEKFDIISKILYRSLYYDKPIITLIIVKIFNFLKKIKNSI